MLNVILGGVGMGKSHLARYLALTRAPSIIVDPNAEHDGDVVCDSFHDFLSYFEAGGPPAPRVIVVVRSLEDLERHDDLLFDTLAAFRGWHIVIDEVDRFCNPKMIPRPLERLINFRRHYGIQLTVVARRAAKIHKDLTELASTIFLFHAHGQRDLEFIRAEVGEEYAQRCPSLKWKEYIRIEVSGEKA